ncbi:unnamed protein product [Prunus brigantina]
MMRNIAAAAAASFYCSSRRWRGMPCLHTNSTVVVFANNYSAFLHSQPSKPIKSTRTQLEQAARNSPKITTVEDAFNVFDRMLQKRPLPSLVRFTQILTQVAKLKHYLAVISLYNQMGFSLSILGKFFKLGLEPNVLTFNTLINGYLLEHRVAEAAALFHKMMRAGNWKPNVVTFGTLIMGFCMRGNNCAAIQLLRKMEERPCKPDLVAYSTIIDSLCKDTQVVDALNLFSEMISKGIAPNVITYSSLMNGVCKLGEWKEAIRLLNETVSKNIFPDVFTFKVLVDTLCKEGMVVEAEGVVEMMIQRDIEPDMVTYNSLMDGWLLFARRNR